MFILALAAHFRQQQLDAHQQLVESDRKSEYYCCRIKFNSIPWIIISVKWGTAAKWTARRPNKRKTIKSRKLSCKLKAKTKTKPNGAKQQKMWKSEKCKSKANLFSAAQRSTLEPNNNFEIIWPLIVGPITRVAAAVVADGRTRRTFKAICSLNAH